ncbi:unannotated protein [freshwater metagenome]|uniref:Unannotated protein n=1 Tax=freshwater metagenome TaxID=449393 RepID=A0A6J6RGZ4_9ZZZZ
MVSLTASDTVMKKRVTSSSVTVSGPPARNCASKISSTDPRDPRTLPKRTETKCRPLEAAAWAVCLSVMRLDHPSTLDGSAALSVEMLTK